MRTVPILFFHIAVLFVLPSSAQRVRDTKPAIPSFIETAPVHSVMIFDGYRYGGPVRILAPGRYALRSVVEFNDRISSLKVPPGVGVLLYEQSGVAGGYGHYTDLLEDCSDLSVYGLDDAVSFLVVFSLDRPGYAYVRGRDHNGNYVPGHWQPFSGDGKRPDNRPPAAVSFLEADTGKGDQCSSSLRLYNAHSFLRTRVLFSGPHL